MTIDAMIRAVQHERGIHEDGVAGVETWTAIYEELVGRHEDGSQPFTPSPEIDKVDDRSESNIATLLPEVRPYARALVQQAAQHGITIVITSGTRTYDEQDALYEQGRSKPGEIVTRAKGGHSNHNFGIAFDVTLDGPSAGFDPVWESPQYKAVGIMGRSLGLSWGGDWTSLNDEPHFELRPAWAKDLSESEMLSQLRQRHENGQGIFA